MSDYIGLVGWERDMLWEGSILASIAHALMLGQDGEISNEHTWDGDNYSVADNQGARGVITFGDKYIIGAVRDDRSSRLREKKDALSYFDGADDDIIQIAEKETLQYLLDDVNGKRVPQITAAFFGEGDNIYSTDDFEDLYMNGGFLFEIQTLEFDKAIEEWTEYYEMNESQVELLKDLYFRKVDNPDKEIILTKNELDVIGFTNDYNFKVCKEAFLQIGIKFS